MGEKWPIQFCLQHATSTVSVGMFYMPQIYDMGQTALLPLHLGGDENYNKWNKNKILLRNLIEQGS
jgi:hypothetical protein